MQKNRSKLYGGSVWVLSGLALITYAFIGLTQSEIPGVEELVDFVQGAQGWYIYLAALISIFLEGLYFIGSVFPGTSFVILTAIVAQAGGIETFLGVILAVFIGWNLAGLANILLAKSVSKTVLQKVETTKDIEDSPELTWFPAFRANTEVAQITEGHPVKDVLLSSLRVKTLTCGGLIVYALVIPYFIDIDALDNEEGFTGLFVIAAISIGVGIYKIYEYTKKPPVETDDPSAEST